MLCTCTNMFARNGLCMHNWQFSYGKLKVYREDFKMVFDKLMAGIYNHTLYRTAVCIVKACCWHSTYRMMNFTLLLAKSFHFIVLLPTKNHQKY